MVHRNCPPRMETVGQDPYHQIEFIITMHFLEKHLSKKCLILDAGGGPGR
jgi:hypothetical protein